MGTLNNWKTKIIAGGAGFLLKIFGGSPRRYWPAFLLVLFGLLVLALLADGLVFWNMVSSAFKDIRIVSAPHVESIDKDALTWVVDALKEKEKTFGNVMAAPARQDPSL